MNYEKIYSRYYLKETDPTFFQKPQEEAYDILKGNLHSVAAIPYIRKCFKSIILDDEIMELTYELADSVDEFSDEDFVTEMFAQGLVICWLIPQIDNIENIYVVLGTKEEKRLQSNYKANVERLESLKKQLRKYIRDYGYINNSYRSS